ncbi:MAG: CHAT domain-containing tetratricopeptide repeat protein [Cytophagales bacterium]|nr:CHAT domain-containing tetratricopeptide repeat protein [Cytophagales bacterium]
MSKYCLIIIISVLSTSLFAQYTNKSFQKIQKRYTAGAYKAAYRYNKKYVNKLDHTKYEYALGLLTQAANAEAIYKFNEVDSLVKLGISTLEAGYEDSTSLYVYALQKAAFAYIQSGNYVKCDKILTKALDKLKNSTDTALKYDTEMLKITNLLKQGFNNEALQLLTKHENYRKIQLGNTQGKNKKETKNTKKLYAQTINTKLEVLLQKGDYKAFDQLLSIHKTWLDKSYGKRNFEYRDFLYLTGMRQEIIGNQKQAVKYYEQANKYTKFSKIEKTGNNIAERLIFLYYIRNKKHESLKNRVKFERAAREIYGRNSLYYARYRLQEIEQLYADSKYDKADKKMASLYNIKTQFPVFHPFNQKLLDTKYKISYRKSAFDQAEDSLKKLVEIKSILYGENAPEYHKEKLRLADFYSSYKGTFAEAKAIQEKSFNYVVEPQLSPQNLQYIYYQQQIANTYELIEKYDLAVKYLDDAAKNIKDYYGADHIEYAKDLEKLAEVLLKKGDYARAEELIKLSVEIFRKNSDKASALEKAATYITLAKLYNTLGMYKEAEDALRKASKLSKRAYKGTGVAGIKNADELAALYIKEGRFSEAEDILANALLVKEKKLGVENKDLIPTLNLLGNLYIITGNYTKAEKNIRRSMAISSKVYGEKTANYAQTLTYLENLYRELGDFKKSEETDLQILNIQKAQLGSNHIDVASTLTRLALIRLYVYGDIAGAEKSMLEATQIVKYNLTDKNPLYAEQLKYLSYIYIESKRYKTADSCLNAANAIWIEKLGKKNVNSADVAMLKGDIGFLTNDYKSAQNKYGEAKGMYLSIFSDYHPKYVKATSKLAKVYFINKDYKNSLKYITETTEKYLDFTKKYFPSLSFSEKSKYWNQIKDDFEFFNTLAFVLKDKNQAIVGKIYDNTIATKALLLSSSVKMKQRILSSKDENLIAKYNDWTAKKQFLMAVLSMSKEQQTQAGADPGKIQKDIELLEKEMSESSEIFANNVEKQNITWTDVKNTLSDKEYAVEIIRFRHYDKKFTDSVIYAALLISKYTTKNPELIILPAGNDFEKKYLKYYKNSVIYKEDDDYSYDVFWSPISKILPMNATVYVSAEGVYNELNIESFHKNNSNIFAIDENYIIPVSNTKELVLNNEKGNNKKETPVPTQLAASKAVFIGNPTFYASASKNVDNSVDRERSIAKPFSDQYASASQNVIKQLPGTEVEVNSVNDLFTKNGWKTYKYINTTADEDTLKKLNNPKILHIATHGYFNPDIDKSSSNELTSTETEFSQNPLLRSGLLLRGAGDVLKSNNSLKINAENGILTAYEAMDLNLDNTSLVVLSACETGKGEVQIGEGVFGLQRAILVAGANAFVMTLFKVDDEITKELMINFYDKWLKTGQMRKSFTEAKIAIKNKYKHPVYWGAFVMVGNE